MSYSPDYDLRPRVKHLPGSAGLTRAEILQAPPADEAPETHITPVIELKPAEARRIADNKARAKRGATKKAILERLAEATKRSGIDTEIPHGNDVASRRARTRIASGLKDRLPNSRPLAETTRASYQSTESEVDTQGHIGNSQVRAKFAVSRDNIQLKGLEQGALADWLFGLPPAELPHDPREVSLEALGESRRLMHVANRDSMTALQEQAITRADQAN